MASFFGGLLQGFGGQLEQKAQRDYEEKRDKRRSMEKILGQVDPTTLDEHGLNEYGELIDQVYGDVLGKGGKGKGGKGGGGMFSKPSEALHHIIGKMTGGGEGKPMDEKIPGTNGATPTTLPAQRTPQVPQQQQQQGSEKAIPSSVPPPPKPPASLGDMLSHRKDPVAEQMKVFTAQEDMLHKHKLEEIQEQNKKGGAYTVKSTAPGSELPEGTTDVFGRPIDPKNHYKIAENQVGERQYLPTEEPKKSALEEKTQKRIQDRMATTNEDEATATRAVRIQDYKTEQTGLLKQALEITGKRLSNEATKLRISRLQQEIDSGSLSQKNAKFLYDAAYKIARQKKSDKGASMETIMADIDTLAAQEMGKMGLSYNEVVEALRGSGTVKPGSPEKKKPASGMPKVTISADGAISVQ